MGAGEALMTPLGVSVSSPPRHRIKPDSRVHRITRPAENSNPGPSNEHPNYFLGSSIVPHFQAAFLASSTTSTLNTACGANTSDSSDDEEDTMKFKTGKDEIKNNQPTLVNRVIFQNASNTNGKFFLPRKNGKEGSQASLNGSGNCSKISDCVQYTFPKINEGMHQTDVQSVVTSVGYSLKLKKQNYSKEESKEKGSKDSNNGTESESSSSLELESAKSSRNFPVDFEQDGFQADESSNGITSDDESES